MNEQKVNDWLASRKQLREDRNAVSLFEALRSGQQNGVEFIDYLTRKFIGERPRNGRMRLFVCVYRFRAIQCGLALPVFPE